mmetsp:Transcript_6056/g.13193  ORF Transcript_6056/g.13193 Transcript_6056/m.13193 type:complete len:196 (-) Transcript_6056:150-737(-)|eukprot:CAMPEP_0178501132 /NCGR_PEP_ID=MMETSP0696-20121128/16776_1 /TAXON_ID=265572 /ORGANISM="Extubocellulus spinifer, Strain CCMP396" /LENGTH=195 /DNA_ID=CAMNT_0020130039 /DNA_START=229 /DNA_END=816 /DNA_ORIENTATION=+
MSLQQKSNDVDQSMSSNNDSLRIGGSKGHDEEVIRGNLLRLYEGYKWRMLPNCTGRYTCRSHAEASTQPPLGLLQKIGITSVDICSNTEDGMVFAFTETKSAAATTASGVTSSLLQYCFGDIPGKDPIIVVPLDDCNRVGLITYIKTAAEGVEKEEKKGMEAERYYVHTLNATSGFRRKLEAMGGKVTDNSITFA